jgi:circadian clock protein KaiC
MRIHTPAISSAKRTAPEHNSKGLKKSPTGIRGLDEITEGGLPAGRPTLVCGGTGCGKTLFAMEFLVHGATEYREPGVFMAFEETAEELTENVASLGFDLNSLIARKLLLIDHIQIERYEFEETGEYDLEGLFLRLGDAIDTIKAKRIVLDSIEVLFARLSNHAIVRESLHRLFRWLKKKGVTVIMTGERGEGPLTRYGLEEYVSDCVISLDHRVLDQATTRRMRVVKYRGAVHGTNEYPFLIDKDGISIWPVTSVQLESQTSNERIPTGIGRLDSMLGGLGYYRGSSILLSGMAGTGKTSVAATLADATCRRGERCHFFSFEESSGQIMRNMSTIGLDLQQWVKKRRLQFQTVRPFHYGLEMHLARIIRLITEFEPHVVIVDQMSGLETTGTPLEIRAAMMRLIDFLKMKNMTALYTDLTTDGNTLALTDTAISSLVDTWLVLRDLELNGERNRGLHILKSRGMAHSNQVREFVMSDRGIELKDIYIGPGGMLTGSARVAQEARERAQQISRNEEIEREHLELKRKHDLLEGQIAALRSEFSAEEARIERMIKRDRQLEHSVTRDEAESGRSRRNDAITTSRSLIPKNGNGKKS